MDPSGLNLTSFLGEDGEVDAILISHNVAILEDLLLRATQRAKKVICAKVPVAWAHTAENQAIGHWLMTLASEGRLLKQTILLLMTSCTLTYGCTSSHHWKFGTCYFRLRPK
jgi:hypothetical protein